jgi:hypothetical protein
MSRTDTTTVAEQTSQEFLGRWQRLVSTTNWEKGRIIHEWREALVKSKADVTEYSDEAWANRVGQVSSQHVGRLRRVYERFGMVFKEYPGLYWSHFQAVLEWHDAEMWLEGAVQNEWSVAAMRRERATAYGETVDEQQVTTEVAQTTSDFDEDAPSAEPTARQQLPTSNLDHSGPAFEGPDFGDADTADSSSRSSSTSLTTGDTSTATMSAVETNDVRPFAELPSLPDDLAEAVEELKLGILRHKVTNWQAVQPSEILAHLEALQILVRSGSDG